MILIITGPPAAGKSTLGPLLAKALRRCAVIEVDWLRKMVVQPHIAPWRGEAGLAQLRLGAANACAVARNCVAAHLNVVILDVLTDETAHLYRTVLADLPHHIVLLLPSLPEAVLRNQTRGQFLTDAEVELLYTWQEQLTVYEQKIDNSTLPAAALVPQLLKIISWEA